ncbi:MAG: hypothetical protein AAF485_24830 [Chloroflexota bacterium]
MLGISLVLFVVALVGAFYFGLKRQAKDEEQQQEAATMQVNAGLVATALAVALLLQLPTLSIDIGGIFTYAFDVVNAFMPLIAIVAGLGLGFALVNKIGNLFKGAI